MFGIQEDHCRPFFLSQWKNEAFTMWNQEKKTVKSIDM